MKGCEGWIDALASLVITRPSALGMSVMESPEILGTPEFPKILKTFEVLEGDPRDKGGWKGRRGRPDMLLTLLDMLLTSLDKYQTPPDTTRHVPGTTRHHQTGPEKQQAPPDMCITSGASHLVHHLRCNAAGASSLAHLRWWITAGASKIPLFMRNPISFWNIFLESWQFQDFWERSLQPPLS